MAQTQNLILRIVTQRGEISSGELLEVLQKLGRSPDAVRAATNRMARAGLLTKIGRGRGNLRYGIGPQGQAVVEQFIVKILRYHMALEGQLAWDGNWLAVTFSVPEGQRSKRDTFRTRLAEVGFGMLSSSVWISPLDREAQVKALVEELGLAGQVALLRFGWPAQRTHELVHALTRAIGQLDLTDTQHEYLFHLIRGMEVLEPFLPQDDSFHWPSERSAGA
jgi:phenylacetic acid degradation operon negative regulatory protein